jgi:sporulation protein YlmC with PRC-barrel domain
MIRKLLASTAIAGLLATSAYAQTTPAPEPMAPAGTEMEQQPQIERAPGHLATNIIGENVYNGVGDDAENIGSVNDIVIDTNDGVEMIIIGVGGFLGLGQKNVAVSWDEVSWAERDGDWWLVINATREQLEAQAEFEVAAYDPALGLPAEMDADDVADASDDVVEETQDMAADVEDTAEDMASDAGEAADDMTADDDVAVATPPAAAPATDDTAATDDAADADTMETAAIDRSTLSEVASDGISADNLIGTTVYGAGEENVGEIDDVILSESGEVDAVIINVGGFLGLGEKEVAVSMDNLQFMSDEDGDYYLYTEFTQEQLEAQPEYDDTTFAEQRDQQLLIVQ